MTHVFLIDIYEKLSLNCHMRRSAFSGPKRLTSRINIFRDKSAKCLLRDVYSLGLLLWIFRGTAAGSARAIKTIIQSHFIVSFWRAETLNRAIRYSEFPLH